jgi:hypothetical protein
MAAVPSAAKATSGLLEAITKSADSNRSAMASFSCRRQASIAAARSRLKRLLADSRPKRISAESSSMQSGYASPRSATNATWPAIAHWPLSAGSFDATSTILRPAALAMSSASSGDDVRDLRLRTLAVPRSGRIATVLPDRSEGSERSLPTTQPQGRLNGSRGSNPLQASK